MIKTHSVDLIVVGANTLDSKNLFETFKDISSKFINEENGENGEKSKEPFCIWGAMEVARIYSKTEKAKRSNKDAPYSLHQAISLARYEQDPLSEILNLWDKDP